jgi:hypothetical protein
MAVFLTAGNGKRSEKLQRRLSMDKKIFENLQNHVFDKGNPWPIWADGSKKPNRLPYFSSWAVWNNSDLQDVTFINPENAYRLKPSIVFVALNFSKPLPSNWSDWQNIHDVGRVHKLLRGTRFEGAYITDFVKDYPGHTAREVRNEIVNNEERRNNNIGWFFEEIDLLGADTIEMYLLGEDTAYLFNEYVKKRPGSNTFRQKVKKCLWIDHYSRRNFYFERNAPMQLGLTSNPEATIHDPLWDDLKQNAVKKQASSILIKKGKGEEKL